MRDWRSLVRAAFPRIASDPGRNTEILDELADHLADTYEALRAAGVDEGEAFARAAAELKAAAARAADVQRAAGEDAGRGGGPMTLWRELRQDAGYGARLLARSPGYAFAAVMTLALAIGATTAIFSVVEGVLLRPPPYRDPDRLVRVWEVSPRGADRNVVSSGNYLDWRDRAGAFTAIGAHSWAFGMALTGAGDPLTVSVAKLTPSLPATLGVQPQIGRLFTEREGEDGGPAAVLLSDSFWRQRFSADRGVIGRSVLLNGEPFTVVGVMGPEFHFPEADVDLWFAQQFGEASRAQRRSHNFGVVARLKQGVTIEAAEAEMKTLARQIAREQPIEMTGWSVNVAGLQADLVTDARPLLVLLFGVVVVVLLVACANLANLSLARATGRLHEIAVRSALGAGRGRIARQLLTESFVLAGLGGGLGVAVVSVTLPTLLAAAPDEIPLLREVRLDPVVLAFAVGVTVLTAVLVGMLPAMRAGGADVRIALQSWRSSAGARQGRIRGALVVVQLALALVLLVGAALLLRSLIKLNAVEYGFRPEGVLTVALDVPRPRYRERAAQLRFYEQLLERVRVLPGVAAAASTSETPGSGSPVTFSFAVEGRPAANPSGREDPVRLRTVTPAYFKVLEIPLLRGRAIEPIDADRTPPVVVFNATLAKRFWPDGNALGHRISFVGATGPWYQIVGVVGDTRDEGLDRAAPPVVYLPFAQKRDNWDWFSWQTLVIRARPGINPSDLLPSIRGAVREIDPSLPLQTVRTIGELYSGINARRRFAMQLIGGFAGLALLLGAIGVYAVVACSVAQRRQEIGIRLALGAPPASVVVHIVTRGVALAVAGIAVGALAAAGLTRFLETLLFGVEPTDAPTFALTAALLLAIATLASWVPARRAMHVDPVKALRTE
jgi:putative ABC transport system permease protein